ncbi:polysaccharide biosynthesis/export family protein [Thalassovita aquimarina]|nr:polysaccharide biosynthesis/export family protein [Thalassovita aquimarina]
MPGKFLSLATLGMILFLSACSLPRGAAIEAEIAKADASETGFTVEQVSRDNIAHLQNWPRTGNHQGYRWFAARRGPLSSRIRAGDELTLTIWDNQTNSLVTDSGQKWANISKLQVAPAGTVFVPYVGDVKISGMTPQEARELLQVRLDTIAPSSQLQLQMSAGSGNRVDLVSGVQKPGSYPLPDQNQTLLSLIAQGGGIIPTLHHPIVQLIRDGQTYRIPAEQLFADASKNVTLRGRDKVIVVEDDRYFIALGATGREQQIAFKQEEITALEALSMTGGVNDRRANLKGVLVLREYREQDLREDQSGPSRQQTIFVLDLTSAGGLFAARNFQIYPGDTLLATESPITSVQTVFGLIGSVLGIANAADNVAN